jgi:hypothetical protein
MVILYCARSVMNSSAFFKIQFLCVRRSHGKKNWEFMNAYRMSHYYMPYFTYRFLDIQTSKNFVRNIAWVPSIRICNNYKLKAHAVIFWKTDVPRIHNLRCLKIIEVHLMPDFILMFNLTVYMPSHIVCKFLIQYYVCPKIHKGVSGFMWVSQNI